MDPEKSQLNLSHEIQKAIELVASALKHTTRQKKLCQVNSTVAKNQIQDDISFHLELLRNREVWLMEQVDVHSQLKEETFESHLNQLCVLLTELRVFDKLSETQELQESQVIVNQAEEVISRVNSELLHWDEVSGICFSADNFALSDAVKSYGTIVEGEAAQKSPRGNTRSPPSSSQGQETVFLQEHFKGVASSPLEDWLIPASKNCDARNEDGIVCKLFEELKKSDQKEWLYQEYQEYQPMDLETVSNRFLEHFQEVKATPADEWLQNEMNADDTDVASTVYRHKTLDTSENIKDWLITPSEELCLTSKREDLVDEGISLSRHSSLEDDKDLKKYSREKFIDNKGGWLLVDSAQEKSTNEQLSGDWLVGSYTSHPSTKAWLQSFAESNGASISDWLAVSESEAEPEYCQWLTRESIERCKSCPGECAKDTFSLFRNVLIGSTNEWLATVSDW